MRNCLLLVIILVYCNCKSHDKTDVTVTGEKKIPGTVSSVEQKMDTVINTKITETDLQILGDIKLGMPGPGILNKLGEPVSRSNAIIWESDGSAHENWIYKPKGLVINMRADGVNTNNLRSVYSISAKAPCILKTTRSLGIGSTFEEVSNIYKGYIDDSASDSTVITVGSVYGGLIFTFKNKKVELIFVGAVSE